MTHTHTHAYSRGHTPHNAPLPLVPYFELQTVHSFKSSPHTRAPVLHSQCHCQPQPSLIHSLSLPLFSRTCLIQQAPSQLPTTLDSPKVRAYMNLFICSLVNLLKCCDTHRSVLLLVLMRGTTTQPGVAAQAAAGTRGAEGQGDRAGHMSHRSQATREACVCVCCSHKDARHHHHRHTKEQKELCGAYTGGLLQRRSVGGSVGLTFVNCARATTSSFINPRAPLLVWPMHLIRL